MNVLNRLRPAKKTESTVQKKDKPDVDPDPGAIAKLKQKIAPSYPFIRRDTPFGHCEELQDHVRIGVYIRDDGRCDGGELWPKELWRREHGGRLPWEETGASDGWGAIAYRL